MKTSRRRHLVLFISVSLFAAMLPAEPPANTGEIDCSEGGATQLKMNSCAARDADEEEKTLAKLLGELQTTLSSSEWKGLQETQEAWRRFVDRQCTWEAGLFEGGSIAPMVHFNCRSHLTRERIDSLKGLLCEGHGMTGPCKESERYDSRPVSSLR